MKNETYTWQATYRDGTTINEFDGPDNIGRSFAEVGQTQVVRLTLFTLQTQAQQTPMQEYCVEIPDGAHPIFFRRRSVVISPTDGDIGTIHCVGWKRDGQAVYLFVRSDGSTLLSSDLQAV